ncbi:hypothetical protein [Brevibacterium sp. CFH 10365]|uniref:hypothetical protein n=1 Tax=Brevibacterium sp. CFH 10365 TaxID=2585207 RepID=UPI001266530C|nr:hypothetical protein [Brevibacterium sp. CFH 10365]
MSRSSQLKAFELGQGWKLSDGVLEMSRLKEVVDTTDMSDREFETHWIQVENGIQHKPFKMIEED